MIVIDTSAWVEYLRKTGSPANTTLKRALKAEDELGVVDVVRMELLAGAGGDEQVATASRLLARGIALPTLSPGDHEYAASLYRAARRSGETVRSMIDCLVTAVAVRLDAPVLAQDRDFEVLRQVCPLRLV
ncbi:MAG: PIN domain nuclease [Actinomycetota bacterium]|nr:PIN domain nuclease [Actinomycetota bacterium]